MCRIFSIISKKPLKIGCWMHEAENSMEKQSREHRDGWGVGYKKGGMAVEKHPAPAYKDRRFRQVFEQIISDIFITHIRKARIGGVKTENTQPFKKGKWVFAHNGVIDSVKDIKSLVNMGRMRGETDSEVFFCLLLKKMKNNSIEDAVKNTVNVISEKSGFSSLNFTATDGKKLYALCEYRKEPGNYIIHYLKTDDFVAVSSERINNGKWLELENHSLMMVDKNLNVVITKVS
ncbi:MAG: class II glutamine amidotransferase [Thermoplasmatales archaeon]|nr:class II glutamine amidotransferase [Thermoplasmatales archaeon]